MQHDHLAKSALLVEPGAMRGVPSLVAAGAAALAGRDPGPTCGLSPTGGEAPGLCAAAKEPLGSSSAVEKGSVKADLRGTGRRGQGRHSPKPVQFNAPRCRRCIHKSGRHTQ